MYGAWQGLTANLAVVAAVVFVWSHLRDAIHSKAQSIETAAFGTVMGCGGVLAIAFGFEVMPGVVFDLRATPIAVAGLFGGPLAAGLAAGPVLLYRLWIGGVGAPAGCLNILIVSAIALISRRSASTPPRMRHILIFALTSGAASQLAWMILPIGLLSPKTLTLAPILFALNSVGISFAGLALIRDAHRRDLLAANALYRAIIEALPDCLNVKDPEGRFIAANPATARLMQAASTEALIGKTDFDFYPEETARRFREEELLVLTNEQQAVIEQSATFDDGRRVWLSTLKVPFRDEAGKVLGLITHNRDVSQTRQVEAELLKTRQHLADALDDMADGLVLYGPDLRIIMCNQQYRAFFPLTAELRVTGAFLPDLLRAAMARGEERLPPDISLDSWVTTILARHKLGGTRLLSLADGRWVEARTRIVADGSALAIFSDVTSRREFEQELLRQAQHDPLTGLANRISFNAKLTAALKRACRAKTEFGILLIDLDAFKQVNDTFGHQIGDRLLVEISRRLEDVCRNGDLVARLGGDEFAIIGEGTDLKARFAKLAQRLLGRLVTPFAVEDVTLLPSASVGFAIYPHDAQSSDVLTALADQALYAAKRGGRRTWRAYSADLTGGLSLSTAS